MNDSVKRAQELLKARQLASSTSSSSTSDSIKRAQELLKARQLTSSTSSSPTSDSVKRAQELLRARQAGITPTEIKTTTSRPKKKTAAGKALRFVGKQLQKPANVVANVLEGVGETIAGRGFKEGIGEIPKDVWDVLTGKSERGFQEQAKEMMPNKPILAAGLGLGMDILADPLNLVGGGLTKIGKIANIINKAKKTGQVVNKGSKVWNSLIKAGYSADDILKASKATSAVGGKVDDLIMGATKAEQAARGQRSFLKVAGKSVLPREVSTSLYKAKALAGKKIGGTISKIPGVKYIGDKIKSGRSLFNTSTGIPGLDDLLRKEKQTRGALGDLNDAITTAKKLVKSGIPKSDYVQVANYLEKGVIPKHKLLRDIGDSIKKSWEIMADMQKKAGLPITPIKDYYPHILNPKIKIGSLPKGLLKSRDHTTKSGLFEHRDVKKFKGLYGDELIGTPESLKLKKLSDESGVYQSLFDKKMGKPTATQVTGDFYRTQDGRIFKSITSGPDRLTVEEANKAFGREFFIEDPAVALAYTQKMNAKAVSSANFFKGVKDFAVKSGGVPVSAPELKGLKFPVDVAKHIDSYYKSIQPEEIAMVLRSFDRVQNWWKGQALIAPSYHLRNFIGNIWNLHLMGVRGPKKYAQALAMEFPESVAKINKFFNTNITTDIITDLGQKYSREQVLDMAHKYQVLGRGQYSADIPQALADEVSGGSWNIFKQNNKLFRGNRAVGGSIEDNARLAGFIQGLEKGLPPEEAAIQVKKFLFDYDDLTMFEKNIMKRAMPFYTFTRKNIPLQLERLVKTPGKFSNLEHVVQAVENITMGDSKPADEKYLSDYIANNTAMRVRYDKEDKSYS